MVSAWIAMIRFPLRMLLLESGQYDGTLVICVARLGKRGRGVFRGKGVNRKNMVTVKLLPLNYSYGNGIKHIFI